MRTIKLASYFVIFFLILSTLGFPSNWYVNKNATGGIYNGLSWETAWRSFSAINWSSINPGDVIYISGGTDSLVFNETLTVGANGSSNNYLRIMPGKFSPSPSGHNGRVIIDANGGDRNIYVAGSSGNPRRYVYIKGFECRNGIRGVFLENYAKCIIIDSLYIYGFYGQAGVRLDASYEYTIDSVTIKNCRIITPNYYNGQTDGIYVQRSQRTLIHNNYIRIRNQDETAHVDAIQAHLSNGFIIYNNILISDSVNSPEGGGMPIILGSEGNNPVIIYNNFMYMGGIWYPSGNYSTTCNLRWYDNPPMPPTLVAHNTIVSNGPRVYGMTFEYPGTCINNIVVQFGSGANYTWLVPMNNSTGSAIQVDNIRHNLIWKERTGGNDFGGSWTGNGSTQNDFDWSTWVNILGGTGVNANPSFVKKFGYEQNQGFLDGRLKAGSPAINQGENIQAIIESYGLPWADILGNPRDSSPDIGAYQYTGTDSTFSLLLYITDGRNLLSVPGINPSGMEVTDWWPNLTGSVYRLIPGSGYIEVTTTNPTVGYWIKHVGMATYYYPDLEIVAHNPISGAIGWNMIGGYENSVLATNVTTNPPGLWSGPIYKYAGGYQPANIIEPGYGYWIRLTGTGQIIIPETITKVKEPNEWFSVDWGRIILTDASGINYTLYAVNGEVDLNLYDLPPAPPAGMFDIRYGSGRIAEDINSSVKTIELNGVTYPVTVRVEGMDIRLMDETGKGVNVNLKSGEEVVISDGTIQKLKVSGELLPTVYSLEQNYPNPFNPSTVIEFSLPEDVSNVKLSIYNALGEKVAELVNSSLTAGKYQYQWNAQNVATGMYIYELRAENFTAVKKMLLLK